MAFNQDSSYIEKRTSHITKPNNLNLKIATSAILTALGVVLSYLNPFGYVMIFGAKINPFAHFINAIAAVLLGPIYAVLIALFIAVIRFSTGTGSILAFPGGMSGALVVGIVREIILRIDPKKVKLAALFEPIGTVFIGGTISSFIIPSTPLFVFWGLFALSAIPGCVLGYLSLIAIQKAGYFDSFLLENELKPINKQNEK
jgi:energy coupling factor transporter S component ThiW